MKPYKKGTMIIYKDKDDKKILIAYVKTDDKKPDGNNLNYMCIYSSYDDRDFGAYFWNPEEMEIETDDNILIQEI